MHCRVCSVTILSGELKFTCAACKGIFHLACGGIVENTYRRLNQERRSQQMCKQCNSPGATSPLKINSDTEPLVQSKKVTDTSSALADQIPTNLKDIQDLVMNKTSNLEKKQNDILDQNNKILESIQFMSSQYEDFMAKIRDIELKNDELTKKNSTLEARIYVLEKCVDMQERELKANNIEIRGIPEIKGENLQDVLFNICKTTKSSTDTKDIDAIHRAAKKNNNSHPREIIVKFKTNIAREHLLTDVKTFNKNKQNLEDKLNTSNIGIAGSCSPIYISEELTFRGKQLWYKTRTAAKEKQYRFAWIKRGQIYLRKNEGTNAIIISDESKLAAL